MPVQTKDLPGSILSSGFTTTQQKALNHFLDAFAALQATGATAEINAAITANNTLYISKALLKSTTAGAADFPAYKVAIAAIP